ncbi:MAG: hypothetical protein GX660_25745 [Clostridiaceae bacterium]|nr:hypothetical protein [Clostridiaceae bacterium]
MKSLKLALCFVLTFVLILTAAVFTSAAEGSVSDTSTEQDSLNLGDANGDIRVNSTDLALLKRYIGGIITDFPYEEALYTMDVNFDGFINSTDFSYLKRYIIEVISEFPVSEAVKQMPEKVFEYNYENHAWSDYNNGFYVDNKGNVHAYDKIKNTDEIIGSVPMVELQRMYILLAKASTGSITEPSNFMADAGTIKINGYLSTGDAPKEVLLFRGGNYKQYNQSPYADYIMDWFEGVCGVNREL